MSEEILNTLSKSLDAHFDCLKLSTWKSRKISHSDNG